ncbi:MAG: class I SAM-dependent methyltransferase [Halieaceae bacterium]|jgi:sterol 24-C-methyltransferase|nr:class I SAM-dependent methyltransferase [Halieaceae bacterium]
MAQHMTNLRDRLGALRGLLKVSDDEFNTYMGTYGALFANSPENTKADYENGVPMQGYRQGSSKELERLYKIIHLLCTLGSVEKMYMPPVLDPSKSVMENQILLEEKMAKDLNVGPDSKVLEIGCGCGAIATSMGEITGATMYGMNIDPSQIEKAWLNPKLQKENFTVGDFNVPLEYEDNTFDAVYAIQPMTYVSDPEFTLREVLRILKPGGIFGFNDVAALDDYDRDNTNHRLLIQHTRELTVFGGFWHYKYWEDTFKNAGFDLLISHEQGAVENIKKEVALYDKYETLFSFLSAIRVVPRRLFELIRRIHANASSYIKAEEEGLLSLNWYSVMQKPQ